MKERLFKQDPYAVTQAWIKGVQKADTGNRARWIKDSEVFRSKSSKACKNRRLLLTSDDLLEGLSGQETIIEKIPLVIPKIKFLLSEHLIS